MDTLKKLTLALLSDSVTDGKIYNLKNSDIKTYMYTVKFDYYKSMDIYKGLYTYEIVLNADQPGYRKNMTYEYYWFQIAKSTRKKINEIHRTLLKQAEFSKLQEQISDFFTEDFIKKEKMNLV